ncbi:MAG: ABC transporter permease subunit [Clostridia bacterium]|nr:ABC transporter permease subunit [Clostridia bacterium]
MTIIKHELKRGLKAFIIWTACIASLLIICVFMFPEMQGEMDAVSELFASMGSFTEAFGMDRLNFGTLVGFYAIECSNVLGLGGAFFAALIAISALTKEEKERTAEFLLSHPVSRFLIVSEKLAAVAVQLVAMNVIVWLLSVASVAAIGEAVPWKEIGLLHLAYLIMQLEIAGICFGLSSFLRRGSLGLGLGLAVLMYFLNIIGNITDSAKFLKYITPFGYTEGADIVASGGLNAGLVLLGTAYALVLIIAGYAHYCRKDIHS